jgi:predicted PurR-regulated permease PerM
MRTLATFANAYALFLGYAILLCSLLFAFFALWDRIENAIRGWAHRRKEDARRCRLCLSAHGDTGWFSLNGSGPYHERCLDHVHEARLRYHAMADREAK